MPFLFSKRKWQVQPTCAVEPDLNNPLFNTLQQLLNPCDAQFYGASGNQTLIRNYGNSQFPYSQGSGGLTVPRLETQAGICITPQVGSAGELSYQIGATDPNARLPWTCFVVLTLSAVSNSTIFTVNAGGSFDRELECFNGLPNFRGHVFTGSTVNLDGGTKVVVGRPYKVVLSCTSALLSLWVDGKLDGTASVANAGYNGYSGTVLWSFGGGGTYNAAGPQIALAGRLNNYAWGQNEVNEWNAYPYQVWKKPKRYLVPKKPAAAAHLLNIGASSGGAGWIANQVNAVGAAS